MSKASDSFIFKPVTILDTDMESIWAQGGKPDAQGYTATDDLFKVLDRHDAHADPIPTEDFSMNYTEIAW